MRAISGLIVAENNRVLRSCGTSARMALMLSVNPILSISSASSITTLWMVDKDTVLRSIKSSRRPGVATMICTPRFRLRIWLSMEEPPYTMCWLCRRFAFDRNSNFVLLLIFFIITRRNCSFLNVFNFRNKCFQLFQTI